MRACDGFCYSNATRDCAGVCGGNATVDSCGVCGGSGDCANGNTSSVVAIIGVLGVCIVLVLVAALRTRTISARASITPIGARAARSAYAPHLSAFARDNYTKTA